MMGLARRNPPDQKSDTSLSFAKKEKEAEGIPSRHREEVQGRRTLTGDVTRTASVKYTRTEIGRATKAGTGTARKTTIGGEIGTTVLIVNVTVIAIATIEIKGTVVVKADTTMTETEIGVRTMIDDETRTGIGLRIMTVALVDDACSFVGTNRYALRQ